jgi:hypothetical protein
MAEASFEFALERLFADAPAMRDADLFAAEVMSRLDRGWTARRVLIGGMGAVGGVIGAAQVIGTDAFGRLHDVGAHATAVLNQAIVQALPAGAGPVGVDLQMVVMVGALAIVAAGFGLARLVREI